jgi:hypothetical protein
MTSGGRDRAGLLILLLILSGLACQTLTGREQDAATAALATVPAAASATPQPTPTQPPTATPLPVPESLDLSAASLLREPAGVPGYDIRLDFQYQGTGSDGAPVEGQITGQGWRVVSPPGLQLELQTAGSADFVLAPSLTVIQLGDEGYLITPAGSCLSDSLGGMSGAVSLFLATSRILSGQVNLAEMGVMVNGRLADIYAFDESNIHFADPTAGQISRVDDGRLAIARDGGYVLQVIIDGRGTSALLSGSAIIEGDLRYELNFVPNDQPPAAVVLPPACQADGPPTSN